jgi:predicted alpha-1,6-mannanase (GH76 family)
VSNFFYPIRASIGIVAAMRMKFISGLIIFAWATVATFAFDARDADAAFQAYNTNFYVLHNGFGHYKKNLAGGHSDFWTQAEQIEMIADAYERNSDPRARQMITESINGFVSHHGTNWLENEFNDDLMWITIACARGYQVTHDDTFRQLAKFHFDAVYQRAWSTNLNGGLWWKIDNRTKNACVNGPAAIAACFLSEICHDPAYLGKAKEIFAWERATLFNPNSGAVYDNIHLNGDVVGPVFTYNTGTFLGAANYLYTLTGDTNYLHDATLAANFTRRRLAHNGILPAYGTGDTGGFNGIFLRWMARFATDQQLWPQYYDWLASNADAAWKVRRADNLSWQNWQTTTPDRNLDSWDCSDTIVALEVIPAQRPAAK